MIKAAIIQCLSEKGYDKVDVSLWSEKAPLFEKQANLKNVKTILAVTGGSGSGRNPVSIELAKALVKKGMNTGLLECNSHEPVLRY